MKLVKKGGKAYLTITHAELASNPSLGKVLKSQGFLGDSNLFDEPGIEEIDQSGADYALPDAHPSDENHELFINDIEGVFKKHGRQLTPELREHLKHTDDVESTDPHDFSQSEQRPSMPGDNGGSNSESYQDNSDPAHPFNGQLGGELGGQYPSSAIGDSQVVAQKRKLR